MRGSVGMMTGSMNIGLFAYPLVNAIWPEKGMVYFGMADIGGAMIMFGLTYFVGVISVKVETNSILNF